MAASGTLAQPNLGALAIAELLRRSGLTPDKVSSGGVRKRDPSWHRHESGATGHAERWPSRRCPGEYLKTPFGVPLGRGNCHCPTDRNGWARPTAFIALVAWRIWEPKPPMFDLGTGSRGASGAWTAPDGRQRTWSAPRSTKPLPPSP